MSKTQILKNGVWVDSEHPVIIRPGDGVPAHFTLINECVRQLRMEQLKRGGRFPSCVTMLPQRWKQLYDEMRAWHIECGEDPEPLSADIGEPNILIMGVPFVVSLRPSQLQH